MSILQEMKINFNANIELIDDGNKLSPDGGCAALVKFEEECGFISLLQKYIHVHDTRQNFHHDNISLILQKINQLILGYERDVHANALSHNDIINQLHGFCFASQASLSRLFDRIDSENIQEFDNVLKSLAKLFYKRTKPESVIVDLDTTHSDTFGKQEIADYNPHYSVVGFQPKLAFDSNGICLGAVLCKGSEYSSKNIVDFVKPIIKFLKKECGITTITLRGDSGFATPKLYDFCEDKNVFYIIRLKINPKLRYLTRNFKILEDYHSAEDRKCYYDEAEYKAQKWRSGRRSCVCSFRQDSTELLFNQIFIVTNLPDCFSAKGVVACYKLRGTMENFIKEIKNGFSFDKMSSSSFVKNQARMMLSSIAYNLMYLMKQTVMPQSLKDATIATIRERIFKIATRLTKHNWKFQIHFDTTAIHKRYFWQTMQNLVGG